MRLLLMVLMLSGIQAVHSQSKTWMSSSLSQDDLERLKLEAPIKVENFQYYMTVIANPENSKWQEMYIEQVLDLFTDSAKMEVSNLSGKKWSYGISNYIRNKVAKYRERYAIVVLEFDVVANTFSDWVETTDINGNKIYTANFDVVQRFCGSKTPNLKGTEGKPKWTYCDTTTKRGTLVLTQETNLAGSYWVMKLHDIKVMETTAN